MYLNWLDVKRMFSFMDFPSSPSLGVLWNVGYVIFLSYLMQISSGIFIAFFFKVGLLECLKSKGFLLKELEGGWVLSDIHLELSNFLFCFIFFHIFKNMYNPVSIHSGGWSTGFVILLLFIFISFTGYSLVGGSLGFWAIVVFMGILEFLCGELIPFFLFSDFGALSDLIYTKIYIYHFLGSLIVAVFIILHFYVVHIQGSSIGVFSECIDFFKFSISSFIKDQLIDMVISFIFANLLGFDLEECVSSDNFLELDFFKVPEEINSEWYLRLFFILLRSVNSKGVGIFFIFFILFLFWLRIYSKGIFGEKFFSKSVVILIFIFIWLLTIFTLNKYGGSFLVTNFMLLSFIFLFDYLLFLFLDMDLPIFSLQGGFLCF